MGLRLIWELQRGDRNSLGLIVGSEKAVAEDSDFQVIPNGVLFVN